MTPEIEDATTQLAKIRPEFVTAAFREAVLAAARASAFHRQRDEAIHQAQANVLAAVAAEDFEAASLAAQELAGLERLAAALPAPTIDDRLIDDALQVAEHRIRSLPVPELPQLACDRELAAWRSIGDFDLQPPAPATTNEEREARGGIQALAQTRESVVRTVEAWTTAAQRPGLNVLAHLAAAGGTLEMVTNYRHRHGVVAELVEKADAARAKAGLRWLPPDGINTPELAALASSRRS